MSKQLYEHLINTLPMACSLQRLIKNENNFPVALNFIAVNQDFNNLFHTSEVQILENCIRDLNITDTNTVDQLIKKCSASTINNMPLAMPVFHNLKKQWFQIYIMPLKEDYLLLLYTGIPDDKFNFLQMEVFFQANLDIMCIGSIDGKFIKVNAEFKRVLGYEKGELERNSFLALIHPDDIKDTKEAIKRLKNNEPVTQFVNRYRHKNGSYYYIEWKAQSYGPYICSSGRDITESKRLQEELTTKNKQLSKLTEFLNNSNIALRDKAITDTMTGLKNRGFFEERIAEEMEYSVQNRVPLCMLIYDIDNFKKVNDTYGHIVGDEVIKQHAELLSMFTRKSDIGFRMGGEEFALLMPNTSINDAMELAERIRITFEETPHPVAGKVTASFGVAQMHHGESKLQWYQRIDSALYMAKSLGRNKVVSAEDTSFCSRKIEINWNEKWNSGNETIDREHKDLLQLITSLFNKSYQVELKNELNIGISDLIEYIIRHFDHEEQILSDVVYPNLEAHKAIHARLVNETLKLRNIYSRNEIRAFAFLSFVLDEVILDHLVTEDSKFFKYI